MAFWSAVRGMCGSLGSRGSRRRIWGGDCNGLSKYGVRVLDRLVELAVRRPWALLATGLAVLAASLAIAIAGGGGLPIGSLAPAGSATGQPDFIVATTGR